VTENRSFDEQVEASILQLSRLSALHPEAWREVDLSMTQFRALLFIRARQPLSVSQVAEALGMRLGAASALINRLDRFGLVRRRENPNDRRQTLVELTPAGTTMIDRVERESIERTKRMFARMSERGREAWLIALEEAVHVLAEEDESK
jgi:MarR family transcriptional regulator, organic hydroperoxide resistance regulator